MSLIGKKAPAPSDSNPFERMCRVTFVDGVPAVAGASRTFSQPRKAYALQDEITLSEAAAIHEGGDGTNRLLIAIVRDGTSTQNRERARMLLPGSDPTIASRSIILDSGADALEWRPGLAVVQCREDGRNDMLSALIEFAFAEFILRTLEQAVEVAEERAESDIALAHRVRYRDRAHWSRIVECAEQCGRMRLAYARLEPQLLSAPRTLSATARIWMTRLLQKSEMESRLESLSDRLEALEDLYEGATQRISEYRWFVSGHALEIGIIVLLLAECMLMCIDIRLHLH
jgi:hypothetical protein